MLPINPILCEDTDTNPAPNPPHYFFSATEGDYGCHQLQPGQCNENPDFFATVANSFATEAECRSRCQGLKRILITARKQNLRRLCFYTCLSFCSQGGWLPSMHQRSHDQRGSASRDLPLGVCLQGVLHRGGSASAGSAPRGVCILGGVQTAQALRDMVNKRWYASYWNEFLF